MPVCVSRLYTTTIGISHQMNNSRLGRSSFSINVIIIIFCVVASISLSATTTMTSSFSTGNTMLIRALSSRAMGRRPAVVAWPCTSSSAMMLHSSLNRVRTLPIGVSKRFASTYSAEDKNIKVKRAIDNTSSSPSSLASIPSCPKLFAQSLNMTLPQVEQIKQARQSASIAHGDQIRSVENEYKHILSPREMGMRKHEMICEHRYKHMRHPFVCRKCWTFEPICVCSLFDEKSTNESLGVSTIALLDSGNDAKREQTNKKSSLPNGVEHLIVWTHHDEWGRTSNTGSLLPLGLESTTMLMKGLVEHESIMNDILNRDDVTPVVLWPGKKGNVTDDNTTISASELRARLDDINNFNSCSDNDQSNNNNNSNIKKKGIVLISIEGTWNSARRMVNKLPPNTLRLNLGTEVIANFTSPTKNEGIFGLNHSNSSTIDRLNNGNNGRVINPSLRPSLLAPLRRQGKGGSVENVSTLEATLIALLALGLDVEDGGRILSIARTKIDRLTEYMGKVKRDVRD